MLIYEKWVTPEEENGAPKSVTKGDKVDAPEIVVEPERKLFGAEDNIPTDEDPEVTYKDGEGQSIEDVTEYKFFYEKGKKLYASTSTTQVPDEENDIEISAWVGDECIAGEAPEEEDDEEEKDDLGGEAKAGGGAKKGGAIEQEVFTVSFTKPRSVTVTPKSGTTFNAGEVVELELVADEGRQITDTPIVYVNGDQIEVVADGDVYRASFVIVADTTLTFDVHTTAATE